MKIFLAILKFGFYAFLLSPLCALSAAAASAAASDHAPALISVRGEGTVEVPPDTAVVTMGIKSEGKTAREALHKNNHDMESILGKLKSLEGIDEDKDLQTSNFRLQPKHVYNKNTNINEIVGYTVSNDLTVRIRDIATTGTILDTAVSLGINDVTNGIQFTNTKNPDDIYTEARKKAVRDAKTKAQTIVGELGVQLGKIYSISEGTSKVDLVGGRGGVQQQMMSKSMSSSSVPIASGENSYSVVVDIRWEIEKDLACQADSE